MDRPDRRPGVAAATHPAGRPGVRIESQVLCRALFDIDVDPISATAGTTCSRDSPVSQQPLERR